MIYLDQFLEIGSQHKVCEDYIIHGETPLPYIILSDGCSSSNNTEMGSRILCYLAKQFLNYRKDYFPNIDYKDMGRWIIHNAEMSARQLGLTMTCLDATLIIAVFIENKVKVFMYGDGITVFKHGDNIEVTFLDYSNNAPYYLSYLIDENRNKTYHDLKHQKFVRRILYKPDGVITETPKTLFAYDYPTILEYELSNLDSLFVCSDGINSFLYQDHTTTNPIDIKDVVTEFTAFKNLKGMYLQRRLNTALKNMKKNNINHYDDLSVGSFLFVKEE
jgi:serine/threonine protein phosphatase PrpC